MADDKFNLGIRRAQLFSNFVVETYFAKEAKE
jgi:hypothetical protein